jgi:hypothetical protein
MSLWSSLRARLGGGAQRHTPGEEDTAADPETAGSRATGGVPDSSAPDTHSTTGTTPSETFVGQSSGDDPGGGETTGADVRGDDQGGAGSGAANPRR